MQKLNILVAGSTGYIGTELIKLLLKKTKFEIISLDIYIYRHI